MKNTFKSNILPRRQHNSCLKICGFIDRLTEFLVTGSGCLTACSSKLRSPKTWTYQTPVLRAGFLLRCSAQEQWFCHDPLSLGLFMCVSTCTHTCEGILGQNSVYTPLHNLCRTSVCVRSPSYFPVRAKIRFNVENHGRSVCFYINLFLFPCTIYSLSRVAYAVFWSLSPIGQKRAWLI